VTASPPTELPPARVAWRRPGGRRRGALAAAAVAAAATLGACGGPHHVAGGTGPGSTTAPGPASQPAKPKAHHAILAPLTGQPVSAGRARREAVVVKIDNIAPALPQTGVAQADVVYEEMVEGGLTRLAAVFQSTYPKVVGPVRSGRLTDEGIVDDLDHPVLAYAGANGLFQPKLAAQPAHLVDADNYPSLFYRDDAREAPHNLYADAFRLAATVRRPVAPRPLWSFRAAGAPFTAAGARPAAGVTVTFPAATARWTWSAAHFRWLRTQDGLPDVDSSGARLSAANVVVEMVPYHTSAYVSGEGAASGGAIPTGDLVGSGRAWILSGGKVVEGRWHRASLTGPTVYEDAAGRPVRLAPGPTWVELPPVGSAVAVSR